MSTTAKVATTVAPAVPRNPWLGKLIWSDLEAFASLKGRNVRSPIGLIDVLLHPGVMAVILWRLASFFHRWYLRPISRVLYILNLMLFSCELMPSATIGPGFAMPHPVGVGVGHTTVVGRNVRLLGLVRLGGTWGTPGQPVVGDDCWLLDGAKVFGAVHIGDRAIVAADSLVLHDVPPNMVAAGRPARVIKTRDEFEAEAAGATS